MSTNVKRIPRVFLCSLFIAICYSLPAWDFGLTFNQNLGVSGYGFRYSGSLVPRVSGLIGGNSDYYASAGVEAAYLDGLAFIPELLRTELTFRSSALAVKAGRMHHSDPLGLVASGLFDGARVSYDSAVGSFYAGAWYTGLIYKKRISIEMTDADYKQTNYPLDTNNYAGTYFAPKRMVAGFGWEHLSLGGEASASAAVLGQFDLSNGASPGGEATGGDSPLNSQYIAGKVTVPFNAFSHGFSLGLGGCFEFIQQSGKFGTGYAAELGIGFAPPISLTSKLSLLARYASGSSGGNAFAFIPVTTIGQGNILGAKLSGIAVISVDYSARLLDTLTAGISSSLFMRNDLKTYSGYPLSEGNGKGYLLGNEFFARLLWSPFSDIQVNLGGGVFLPSMGDAAPKAESSWRVELNVILLLY
jgi:hypothetical protein